MAGAGDAPRSTGGDAGSRGITELDPGRQEQELRHRNLDPAEPL